MTIQELELENSLLRADKVVLVDALEEIKKGKGRYSMVPIEHACNAVEDMKELAVQALKTIGVKI